MFHFYKAVKESHIRGVSLIPSERGRGIQAMGLDPSRRNSSGGATVVAAAQSGRALSASDRSGIGQCLTGDQDYAKEYCDSSESVLLRVSLPQDFLPSLVLSAEGWEDFAHMKAAEVATECTAIDIVPPRYIEFLKRDGTWARISDYHKGDAKDDWED